LSNATVAQINSLIMSSDLTDDELNVIQQAITFSRAQIAKKNRWTLVKGTKVKFTSSKTGQVVVGTVEKVNRKYVRVLTPTTRWRVPANMLSAV
jgi:exosome complex RNA-binding protein Csl4